MSNPSRRGVDLSAFDPMAKPSSSSAQHATGTPPAGNPAAPSRAAPMQPPQQHQSVPASAWQQQQETQQTASPKKLDANQIRYLEQQGFSSGLIRALSYGANAFPLRIWILDNSGNMSLSDSHRIAGSTFDSIQNVAGATRWEELQDCVAYHAQMAGLFLLPTRFALLNDPGSNVGPSVFGVGETGPGAGVAREISVLKEVMTKTKPHGSTPLSHHIATVQRYIAGIAPQLRRDNKTITVVLATQGLPTDANGVGGPAAVQEFIHALRSLEGLPIWVVVRLCTDDENMFEFYNSIDAQFNLPYDVLDDFFGESLEVYLRNPWLNYGLPLHRFRELGFHIPVLDAIDERALSLGEVRDLCSLLFAGTAVLPDPAVDWNAFSNVVSTLMAKEKQQWNPVTKKVGPWINLHDLNTLYGNISRGAPQNQSQQFGSHVQYQQFPPQQFAQQQIPPTRPVQQPQYNQQQQGYQAHSQPGQQQPFQQGPQQSSVPHAPPPPPPHPPTATAPVGGTAVAGRTGDAPSVIKKDLLMHWAMEPPSYQLLRPIDQLLGSVHSTFPPAFGVEAHDYFLKWKPFSQEALSSGGEAVLKRAVRKMKFFLHPDKLPKDFSEKQSFLCKMLWDVTADSWEAFPK